MDDDRQLKPYGLWESPLTPDRLAGFGDLEDLAWDESGALVWLEKGPAGPQLRFQLPSEDAARDLTADLLPRGRVGYGGGAFTAGQGSVYFVDGASGRLYRQPLEGGAPRPITPPFGGAASPARSPDGRWLLYVHADDADWSLAAVDAIGDRWPQRLHHQAAFYMQPCWHPAGDRIAWVSWDPPHMPWDASDLYLGELAFPKGTLPVLRGRRRVAGGPGESVLSPAFSPDGSTLAYLSDRDGWWGIYLHDLAAGESRRLTRDPAEYGGPAWVQGLRFFAYSPDGEQIYALRAHEGATRLVRVEVRTGDMEMVALDDRLSALAQVSVSPDGESLALIASGPDAPPRLLSLDRNGGSRVLAWTSTTEIPREWFSRPQSVRWAGEDGGQVHGLFYPPTSPRFRGEGPPPLVVYVHSGPTSQAVRDFTPRLAFFTSRGFAVLAVNYRGSSGYGRTYRQVLGGRWGELDVADVVGGARELAESGQIDRDKMVLMGGSAGGATALLALARHPELFSAAIVSYPVVDHLALEGHIHPFEAHYSRGLLGPLPEAASLYRERSPLTHAGKIRAPVLLFHGEEDRVVPRSGSDALADALRGAGVPIRYHVFPGEGHGFRDPETLDAYYQAIEEFLRDYVI